jgi:hypothetical protein
MAYTFQGQEIVAPFRLSSNEPVFSADTVNLRVRRVKQGAQRWEMEFKVVMQDPSSTFADMLTTFHDAVTLEMPQLNVRGEVISSGTSTGAITTSSGAEPAGDDTIAISGLVTGTTINKGRFIKFSSHDKIYMVTETVTGDGSDFLKIYPSLRQTILSGDQVLYRDNVDAITFTAYRDVDNIQGITYADGILSDLGTINLIEAL